MDALQIFVRGFESREAGQQVVTALNELGFEVQEAFDGTEDDRGGLIGTRIMPTDELETDDLDAILEAVALADGTFIQYRRYDLRDADEMHTRATAAPPRLAVVREDE